jgi:hypothetical protein
MGFFRLHRSFGLFPGLRLNLSKSGVSVSAGFKGLHYTVGSKGTRTTVGLPGSGLSWTEYHPNSSRRISVGSNAPTSNPIDVSTPSGEAQVNQNITLLESAPIAQLVARSTVEIAETLGTNQNKWRFRKTLMTVLAVLFGSGIILCAVAAGSLFQSAIIFMIIGASIILCATALYGRQSLIISLEYDLSDQELKPFNRLAESFKMLANCKRVWQIPLERSESDWKRNAGVSTTVERNTILLGEGHPALIKSNIDFLKLPLAKEILYFTPDAILIVAETSVAALRYDDLEIVSRRTRFIEYATPPSDAQVVGESWLYVNKDSGPDRRFGNNRKLPICLYAEIDLRSGSGLNNRIHCSSLNEAEAFVGCVVAMRTRTAGGPRDHLLTDAQPRSPVKPIASTQGVSATTAYAKESEAARDLVSKKGKFWEFLLVQELLHPRLQALKNECDQFDELLKSAPKKQFSGSEFNDWLKTEIEELDSTVATIKTCVDHELAASMGEPGVSGDPMQMLNTVNSLFGNCRRFLIFELILSAADLPRGFQRLQAALRGISLCPVRCVEDLTNQWDSNVEAMLKGSHTFNVKVSIEAPQLHKASIEIERLSKHPELFR